jgi:hypothetical protein
VATGVKEEILMHPVLIAAIAAEQVRDMQHEAASARRARAVRRARRARAGYAPSRQPLTEHPSVWPVPATLPARPTPRQRAFGLAGMGQ